MSVGQRAWVNACGNEACHVRHVHQQVGADFVGNLAELGPVDQLRVGRETGNDHLGLVLTGKLGHLVVIDQALLIQTVLHRIVLLA